MIFAVCWWRNYSEYDFINIYYYVENRTETGL